MILCKLGQQTHLQYARKEARSLVGYLRVGIFVQDFWGAGLYLTCSAGLIETPFNASKAPRCTALLYII